MTLNEQKLLGEKIERFRAMAGLEPLEIATFKEQNALLKEQNALLRSRLVEWQQLAAAMCDCIGIHPFSVDSYNKELLVLARYEALKATII